MIKLAGNLKHFTGDTMAEEFGTLKKLDGYVYLLDSQWHCAHRTGGDAPIRKETRASLHFSAVEQLRTIEGGQDTYK